jgi:excisionase family DNA binding protein
MQEDDDLEPLMLPAEVAELFKVTEGTAKEWARRGFMGSVRTPGGAWRFQAAAVRKERAAWRTPATG